MYLCPLKLFSSYFKVVSVVLDSITLPRVARVNHITTDGNRDMDEFKAAGVEPYALVKQKEQN